jgi:NAD(P)-dependent dehydrogenase (short-subunit alcohol dehydrogenase family)
MTRVAVVTGATRGLGLALAEGLAQRMAPDDVVYLTGRDPHRIALAAATLRRAVADVRPYAVDVRDNDALATLANRMIASHGGVDILFSNAAARLIPDTPWTAMIEEFVDTNNLGTTRVLRNFSPALRAGGRLIVVASEFGRLRYLPANLHTKFDMATMSMDDLDAVMVAWRDTVLHGTATAEGWPDWINIPSKVGQVAAVRVLARERYQQDADAATLVTAVCPGLIDTDASRPWFADMSAAQTPSEAAEALLELALGPHRSDAYGELLQFGQVRSWR